MECIREKRKGFTLVEIIVAVAIVALLASVVYANLGEGRKKARDAQRKSDFEQIQLALRVYRDTNSTNIYPSYPSGDVIGDGLGLDTNISSYLTDVIKDPKSGTTGYEYYYDSSHDCNGTIHAVLIALTMEQSQVANYSTACDATPVDLGNGVMPSANSYILLLN